MWDDILKHLPDFENAVLTGLGEEGYPFSVRCRPRPDEEARVLRVQLPEYVSFRPSRASLLCHEHDENLWNLKSFLVRGDLRRDGLEWSFYPKKFVPGVAVGGLMGMARFIADSRRTTNRYLKKRGLSRPVVPWKEINAIKGHAKESRRARTIGGGP